VPLGGGTLLLGIHLGLKRLRAAGLIEAVPRLVGVQSAACSPLAAAFRAGLDDVTPVQPGATIAEGIRIDRPPRSREILAAVRETGGQILEVTDDEVRTALRQLLVRGLFVEPTSAVAYAGFAKLGETRGLTVLGMTAHGLKAANVIDDVAAGEVRA
jgi:threonine synthase